VGRLKRRIQALEEAYGNAPEDVEESIRNEVLTRMTDEELEDYAKAMERASESGGVFSEEDEPILQRADVLYREVAEELCTTNPRMGLLGN
jgi:hypothetical protein